MKLDAHGILQLTKLSRAIREIDSDAAFKLSNEEDQINLLTCATAFANSNLTIHKTLSQFWNRLDNEQKQHLLSEGITFKPETALTKPTAQPNPVKSKKPNTGALPSTIKVPTKKKYRGSTVYESKDINSPEAQVYLEQLSESEKSRVMTGS
ncbi:MAG: hypothetical protein KUG82_12470 [Pseudomonadales bacterium]|nr:hypothetical protein [Pseudomonadales bacterium]